MVLNWVLIESDWNLKTNDGGTGTYTSSINRIRLEFKEKWHIQIYVRRMDVLIESDWNLKYTAFPPDRLSFRY